jgi:hypothetical protein
LSKRNGQLLTSKRFFRRLLHDSDYGVGSISCPPLFGSKRRPPRTFYGLSHKCGSLPQKMGYFGGNLRFEKWKQGTNCLLTPTNCLLLPTNKVEKLLVSC